MLQERTTQTKAVPARQHHFAPGREYTVGVEEELLLVDQDGGAPAAVIDRLLDAVPDQRVKPELMQCQVEIASSPARRASDVLEELCDLRARIANAAAVDGARLVGCGTHPVAAAQRQASPAPAAGAPGLAGCGPHRGAAPGPQPITSRSRYRELVAALRYPVRRELCS